MIKGATTIPIIAVLSTLCVWCAGLSTAVYTNFGTTSALTASVGDIKDTLDKADLPTLKAEINFLATQRGYKPQLIASTTSNDLKTNTQ